MKTLTKKTLNNGLLAFVAATSISVLSVFTVSTVAADNTTVNERHAKFEQGQRAEHGRKNIAKRMHRMVKTLDLTESQIELLKLSSIPQSENQEEIRALRQQLRALSHSSNYSERDAVKIAEELTDLTTSNIVARASAENAFYISLSEEQVTKLNSMKEKGKNRRENRKPQ
ncbi:MAG: Spy/CpxP family protein refolding chaperone [Cellvibrionaceae bacterium]